MSLLIRQNHYECQNIARNSVVAIIYMRSRQVCDYMFTIAGC